MKLEASLKHFSPQGMHITDDAKSTSPNRLNGTDIMTGIGVTSSRARFGWPLSSERLVSAKRMNSLQFRRWRSLPSKTLLKMSAKPPVTSSAPAC